MTKDFMINPTKKHLIIFTILWVIVNGLLVLSSIDIFTKNLFQKKTLIIGFLMIWSTVKLIQLYRNYWDNKKYF